MISIRVIEVDNLYISNKKLRKTLISCFSNASYHYYYGSFKSKSKTAHPRWNKVFNVDLFRLIDLNFSLYGAQIFSKNVFIGNVHIDFVQLLSEPPGNQILINPGREIRCEFPINSTHTTNSYLSVSFSYSPKIYHPIQFKPATYFKQIIHLWATFSPPIENDNKNQVEIEFLQASTIYDDDRRNTHNGVYYILNNETPFECTAKSSSPRFFLSQTGQSQVHSICLTKIEGCVTFFILNVKDFSGTVTLHFVLEKKGQFRHFSGRSFMKPKTAHPKIGTIETVDVSVKPNTKKLVPIFNRLGGHPYLPNSFEFGRCKSDAEIEKRTITTENNAEIEFHEEIMKNMASIHEVSKVHFLRVNVLPIVKTVSLKKTMFDYGLKFDPNLRFYIGGSTTYTTGNSVVVDTWKQGFIVYDKGTGQRCTQFSDEMKPRHKSFLPTKFKWNSILGLNLNSIGTEKVLVYFIHCDSCLESANESGFFMISHIENQKETLMFRNVMFPEVIKEHFASCFRFEFIDDDWQIFPMRHYFKDEKEMNFAIDSMHSNNWVMPEILLHQKHDVNDVEFSDDEYLIE